jgi:hypothetical protein
MEQDAPAKPRLEFGRGRATPGRPDPARKALPMDEVLARMAGKVGEKRRAAEAQRAGAGGRSGDELAEGEPA